MRESPKVADSTRDLVLKAAGDLGYVYNRAAAAMRSRRTGAVGLIVTTVGNPFFAEVAEGMEAAFTESGLTLILTQHSESLSMQRRQIEVMLENRVDGVLLVPVLGTPDEHLLRLKNAGVATVMLTRRVPGVRTPYVGSDNLEGARMAVEHLIEHGSSRVAFIGGLKGTSSQREREDGVFAAVARTGGRVALTTHPAVGTPESGYAVTRELMESTEPPDALLAYNDNVALGVMAAVSDAGRVVGRDVRVAGFDDVAVTRYLRPALTSVNSRPSLIGSIAAQTLQRVIADPSDDEVVLVPNSLSVRESCGCGNRPFLGP
jgi:LacI family transcriptional regulator